MDFLKQIEELIGGAGDAAVGAATKLRYGVSPEEKQGLMYSRSLPGAPSYVEDPEAAERYASTYLGAKKWGQGPADFFNSIALSDIFETPERRMKKKRLGARGAQAGATGVLSVRR